MGIGTLEVHPIDMIGAYGAIADGGKLMPRTTILKVVDSNGNVVWPDPAAKPAEGRRPSISPQTAYIITDILAGNTELEDEPVLGRVGGLRRRRPAGRPPTRRARRTTTATSTPTASSPRPKDPKAPGARRRRLDGQQRQLARHRHPVARIVRAALVADHCARSAKGMPIVDFQPAEGPRRRRSVDAFTGMKPGPFTTKTVKELFIQGTEPTQTDDFHRTVDIDAASGLLWQDGCVGPKKTVGALDFSQVEASHPSWQQADNNWTKRAARGAGRRRRPEGHPHRRTSTARASSRSAGRGAGSSPRRELCPLAPPPTPPPCDNPFGLFCPPPVGPTAERRRRGPGKAPEPESTPKPVAPDAARLGRLELDDRGAVAALAAFAGPDRGHERVARRPRRGPRRAAPRSRGRG